MKSKRVELTHDEKIALQTMVSLEIKSNKKAEEIGITEPVWGTENLKALYKKISGHEWEE